MRIVKGLPGKCCLLVFTAVVMAAGSLTYVDAQKSLEQKGLLKKTIGWLF